MEINMHVQKLMDNFLKTGTLGRPKAERHEFQGMEAMLGVSIKSGDMVDITSLDNKMGDRDARENYIDLNPKEAINHVADGFGEVTSFKAEFKGPADNPDEAFASIEGPTSRKIFYGAASDPSQPITFFEALAKDNRGMIVASRFTMSEQDKSINGYAEALEIPWHIAR
jgi:hypothetical protein